MGTYLMLLVHMKVAIRKTAVPILRPTTTNVDERCANWRPRRNSDT